MKLQNKVAIVAGVSREIGKANPIMLADEGVRVNAVIPTVTDTDRFKNTFTIEEQEEIKRAGKLSTPEEVAKHVLDLIMDKTRNGEIFIDERVFIKTEA